jgi:hypothetical protein
MNWPKYSLIYKYNKLAKFPATYTNIIFRVKISYETERETEYKNTTQ